MGKKKSITSVFQIHDWHIFNLIVENNVFSIEDKTPVDWTLKTVYSSSYNKDESFYTCVLETHFSAAYKSDSGETKISGMAGTLITMSADAPSDEMEKKAMNTCRLNGMSFSILSLRNLFLQLSTSLGLEKRLFFPNIDLNAFEFDKQYTISI